MLRKTNTYTKAIVALWLLVATVHNSVAFTKSGQVYITDGSQADVAAAVANAINGDTVNVPSGTFTWGTSNTYISINKAITLSGAGTNSTTIQLATNGPTYANATIRLSGGAMATSMAINGAVSGLTTAFSGSGTNGWRVTNIHYTGGPGAAYFLYFASYGVIDHCTIIGANNSAELIFGRGPTDSWQTASSLGSSNAVYVEDCTFGGQGYVCDANSNARMIIRFCTINGPQKIDGHGKASNSPARSVRHMEVYGNRWTYAAGAWTMIEIRGGTGMVFDNHSATKGGVSVFWPSLFLTEYGCINLWANFNNVYQTPTKYPIGDQIGTGMDPKASGSEPMYLWNNTASNLDYKLSWAAIPSGAISTYTNEVGNPASTFTMQDIIAANRDYFKGTNGMAFDGSGGIGRGTKAEMQAITPTRIGVGFWVTDEADWNTKMPGPDGQLYVWSGSEWLLKYTPFTYPHPLATPSKLLAPPANLRKIGS